MSSWDHKFKNCVLLALFAIAYLRGRDKPTPTIIVKQLRCHSDPSYIQHVYCSVRKVHGMATKLKIVGSLQQEVNTGTVYVNILQRLNVDGYQTTAYGFVESLCGILANKKSFFGTALYSRQLLFCPYEPQNLDLSLLLSTTTDLSFLKVHKSSVFLVSVIIFDDNATLVLKMSAMAYIKGFSLL